MRILKFLSILGFASLAVNLRADETPGPAVPPFTEFYSLIRSNLTGVTDSDLNRAAVAGLLNQLQSQVTLVTNASASELSGGSLISKSTVLDGAYWLLRIGRVSEGLAKQVTSAYDQLRATNKLKGLIVDLRFATGRDYAAAAAMADLFFNEEQSLLQWGEASARTTAKTNAIDQPLVILINSMTSGSAEALAAALRLADGAVLIGAPSAGRAYLFKDFTLSDGQVLRVASGWITVGHGQALTDKGLKPDIIVPVPPAEERAYFDDPYRVVSKPLALLPLEATTVLPPAQSTNRSRRRPNEADLVRMQRDGVDLSGELPPVIASATPVAVISDPVLSRGLDLLKGLALALKRR